MATTVNPLLDILGAEQNTPRRGIWSELKQSAIMGIKDALGVDYDRAQNPAARVEQSQQRVYDEFIAQVKQQQDLLLDATQEQTDIFKKLELTVEKLRTANHADSKLLLDSIEKLAKQLRSTPETDAKRRIEKMLPIKQAQAQGAVAQTQQLIQTPAAAARSAAIPALLQASPAATALYQDAGLISSESEGDRVQTGEREADMAAILGFLGNAMGSDNSSGTGIVGAPLGAGRKTAAGGNKPVAGAAGKRPAVREVRGRDGVTRKIGPDGKFLPKSTVAPKTSMLSKLGGARGGLATIGLTLGLDYAADKLGRETTAGAGADVAASTLGYAGTGALIGSFVPGIGTAIGGAVGGAYGLGRGLLNNAETLFGPTTKQPDAQVLQQSLENKQLTDQVQQTPAAPVIINNQQTVGNNTPPAYIAPSLEARPKESALDRYITREAVY